MKAKKCTKCSKMLSLSSFGNHRISKDGLAHRCKECAKKNSKIWNNTASGIYSRIKSRTKHYQRTTVEMEREDFIEWYDSQERVCGYCSIPEECLHLLRPRFQAKSGRLTVDRKDNDQGYFRDNLVLACCRCNSIKCDELTYEEMREFAQKYLRPKWENRRTKKDGE